MGENKKKTKNTRAPVNAQIDELKRTILERAESVTKDAPKENVAAAEADKDPQEGEAQQKPGLELVAKPTSVDSYLMYKSQESKLARKLDDVVSQLASLTHALESMAASNVLEYSGVRRLVNEEKNSKSANQPKSHSEIKRLAEKNDALEQAALLKQWSTYKAGKPKDVVLPVNNVMMMKFIEEDNNGELFLVGTMIQNIIGCTPVGPDGSMRYFQYRFNELAPNDTAFQFRRTRVKTPASGHSTMATTANYRIHLPRTVIHNKYPFIIASATCKVEMSTYEQSNLQIRPDMVFKSGTLPLNTETLEPTPFLKQQLYNHWPIRNHSYEVFQKCFTMDLVTPFPSVYVKHEAKAKYTPKFELTFYLCEPIMKKVIQVYFPLILMLMLNVYNMGVVGMDGGTYIENSSSIALAVVFLLPSMYPATKYKSKFTTNDFAMLLLFLSIIVGVMRTPYLSSGDSGDQFFLDMRDKYLPWSSYAATALSVLTFCNNLIEYMRLKRRIVAMNCIPGVNFDSKKEAPSHMSFSSWIRNKIIPKEIPEDETWQLYGKTLQYQGGYLARGDRGEEEGKKKKDSFTSGNSHIKSAKVAQESKKGENAADSAHYASFSWRSGYFDPQSFQVKEGRHPKYCTLEKWEEIGGVNRDAEHNARQREEEIKVHRRNTRRAKMQRSRASSKTAPAPAHDNV